MPMIRTPKAGFRFIVNAANPVRIELWCYCVLRSCSPFYDVSIFDISPFAPHHMSMFVVAASPFCVHSFCSPNILSSCVHICLWIPLPLLMFLDVFLPFLLLLICVCYVVRVSVFLCCGVSHCLCVTVCCVMSFDVCSNWFRDLPIFFLHKTHTYSDLYVFFVLFMCYLLFVISSYLSLFFFVLSPVFIACLYHL